MDLFKAVCSYDNPQRITTPEIYCDKLLLCLNNVCENDNGVEGHVSFACKDSVNCAQCKCVVAVSSVASIFSYDGFKHGSNDQTLLNNSSQCLSSSQDSDEIIIDIDCNQQKQTCSVISSELAESLFSWYQATLTLFRHRKLSKLLVSLLNRNCLFTSYLGRKTLMLGIQMKLFEVSEILPSFCSLNNTFSWRTGETIDLLIEILKDKNKESTYDKSLTINAIVDQSNESDSLFKHVVQLVIDSTSSAMLYKALRFFTCIFKFSEDHNTINYVYTEFEMRLFPLLIDHVCTVSRSEQGHFLCIQLFKVIKSMLNTHATGSDQVYHTALKVLTTFPVFVGKLEESHLLSGTHFVGGICKSKENLNSTLSRTLTLVVLKASVIVMTGTMLDKETESAAATSAIQSLFKRFTIESTDDLSKDWLPQMFGDQDNHWIDSLNLLIQLWKLMKSYTQQGKEHNFNKGFIDTDSNSFQSHETEVITNDKFLLSISPHKLFLQFVAFIDHDHLVLADWLASPETSFLSYFTTLLHLVEADWDVFVLACSGEDPSCQNEIPTKTMNEENNLSIDDAIISDSVASIKVDKRKRSSSGSNEGVLIEKVVKFEEKRAKENVGLVMYSDSDASSDENEEMYNDSDLEESVDKVDIKDLSNPDQGGSENCQDTYIDIVMTMLIRLRFHLERLLENNLFPYNITPILRLISICEDLYEI